MNPLVTSAEAFDVTAATRSLRARADAKDEAFFVSRGFQGTRGFYERFLRLGAVLVWCERAAGDARATLWSNRSARIETPSRAMLASLACLNAGWRRTTSSAPGGYIGPIGLISWK